MSEFDWQDKMESLAVKVLAVVAERDQLKERVQELETLDRELGLANASDVAVLEKRLHNVHTAMWSFINAVQDAGKAFRAPKGGQQVSFHGDFANITPSVLGRLEWWANLMEQVMEKNGLGDSEAVE